MIFFPLSQPKSVPASCNQRTLTDSRFRWIFLPCLMTTYNNSQCPVLIPDKMLKHLQGWNYLGRIIAEKVFTHFPSTKLESQRTLTIKGIWVMIFCIFKLHTFIFKFKYFVLKAIRRVENLRMKLTTITS